MDNPRAASGIAGFVSETVGSGIRPHSKHSNPDTRRKIEKDPGRIRYIHTEHQFGYRFEPVVQKSAKRK